MQTELALSRLDELMAALGHEHAARCTLLREHLDAARWYLVGAMPVEYEVNLRLAADTLDCIGNAELRRQMDDFIRRELSEGAQAQAGVMRSQT